MKAEDRPSRFLGRNRNVTMSRVDWLRKAAFRATLTSLRSSYRLNLLLRHSRPRPACKPIFVLSTLRTGSNLLVSYLNSMRGVRIAGEILHPDQMAGVPRGISKTAVLRHIQLSLNRCDAEICGAKLPSVHLQSHDLNAGQ